MLPDVYGIKSVLELENIKKWNLIRNLKIAFQMEYSMSRLHSDEEVAIVFTAIIKGFKLETKEWFFFL